MVLLLTDMSITRKQQTDVMAEQGRALAAWLNSKQPSPTGAAAVITRYVLAMDWAARRGSDRRVAIRTSFSKGWMGLPLTDGRRNRLALKFWQEEHLAKGSSVQMNLCAELRPRGGGIEFKIVPQDEESEHLYAWGNLLNSGNVVRLRICPNCAKFWYCSGRLDRRACSDACKVGLWQKTPQGRAKKAGYMRRYRNGLKERGKKQELTGKRRKASKRILANLGK